MKTMHQQAFQPIENYGLIGNLCTAALVGMDSSIDFLCFPEFDSPTVFAALLDSSRGGSFSIRPQISGVQSKQMYAAESNVLITRFLSEGATAEIIDFMPLTASTQKRELVRMGTHDKVSNKNDDAAGKAKEAVGRTTGDDHTRAEGKLDQAKSSLKDAGEKVKDAFKK